MAVDSVVLTAGGRVDAGTFDFEQIVRQHRRRVLFLALDLTGNYHDAEDLAQETFLRAYTGLGRFRGDADLGTWLHRITVNSYIDRCRSRSGRLARGQRSWDDADDPVPPLPDPGPAGDPERQTEAAAIQQHIDAALQQLSPQQRSVFVLRHYQELKLREIASALGVSEGTVKATLHRAVQRLQEALAVYRPELGLEKRR